MVTRLMDSKFLLSWFESLPIEVHAIMVVVAFVMLNFGIWLLRVMYRIHQNPPPAATYAKGVDGYEIEKHRRQYWNNITKF